MDNYTYELIRVRRATAHCESDRMSFYEDIQKFDHLFHDT